jgi:hypothetical protein
MATTEITTAIGPITVTGTDPVAMAEAMKCA